MRTPPYRRDTARREHRSTRKRANPHQDGTHSPSRHQEAPSDRRDRRSSSTDRRRLTDCGTTLDRQGNLARRRGTTYRGRVGCTGEADAYSPSLGGGQWEVGGRFSGSAARKTAGLARRSPFTTGPEILCQAGFLFSKSAFRSTQHSTIHGCVTPEQLHIYEQMCASLPPWVPQAALQTRQVSSSANPRPRSSIRSAGDSSPTLKRTSTPSRRFATVLGGFTGTARLVTPPQLHPISNS